MKDDIIKFIRSEDMFGAPLKMKYKGKGGAYSTLCSALTSIGIKIFLAALVVDKLVDIASRNNATYIFNRKAIDESKVNNVKLEEEGLLIYFQLHYTSNFGVVPINRKSDVSAYIEIKPEYQWQQRKVSEDEVEASLPSGTQQLGWKICTKSDFEKVDGLEIWKERTKEHVNSMICVQNIKDVKLNITSANPITSKGLRVFMNPVADTNAVNNFFRTTYINMYYINRNVDFTIFGKMPVQPVEKLAFATQLFAPVSTYAKFQVRKNFVTVTDAIISFGKTAQYEFLDIGDMLMMKIENLNFRLLADFVLSGEQMSHARKMYGLMDVLRDYGGTKGALTVLFGLIFIPINTQMAGIFLLRKLFTVTIEDENGRNELDLKKDSAIMLLIKSKFACFNKRKTEENKVIQEALKQQAELMGKEQEITKVVQTIRNFDKLVNQCKVISEDQSANFRNNYKENILISEFRVTDGSGQPLSYAASVEASGGPTLNNTNEQEIAYLNKGDAQ